MTYYSLNSDNTGQGCRQGVLEGAEAPPKFAGSLERRSRN